MSDVPMALDPGRGHDPEHDPDQGRDPAAAPPAVPELLAALSLLARAAISPDFTPESVLCELCTAVAGVLEVDGVAVTSAEGGDQRVVLARPSALAAVERDRQGRGEGPGIESAARQTVVRIDDLERSDVRAELVADYRRVGMRSLLAVPLLARDRVWGVLSLFRSDARPWSGHDVAVATLLVNVSATYLMLAAQRDDADTMHRDLEYRATHDELTGLPNRGLLVDRLEHALLTARRHRTAVAVMYIDVDGFKEINDTRGHAFGDLVLLEVGRRLSLTLRANDTVGRLGGDEFLVMCEALTGTPGQIERRLRVLGRRIRLRLRDVLGPDELAIEISASVGAAVSAEGHSARQLIGDADRAMYAAKRQGGDRLVVGDPDVVSLADYRLGRGRPLGG